MEAEDFSILITLQVADDPDASGGQYLHTPAGSGDTYSPPVEATYTVNVPSSGDCYMWIRVLGPDGAHDAFYIGCDGDIVRTYLDEWGEYVWVPRPIEEDSQIINFHLDAGTHTIDIGHGEELARIDRILLTNNPNLIPVNHRSDSSKDGCINMPELISFIDLWKLSSEDVPMPQLMEAIGLWKQGTGCS